MKIPLKAQINKSHKLFDEIIDIYTKIGLKIIEEYGIYAGPYVETKWDTQIGQDCLTRIYFKIDDYDFESGPELLRALKLKSFL